MKLMLNMMVKNESARIERALASALPYIDSWVIIDTGSTDDTKEKIINFFLKHQRPGEIHDAPFKDWSQARNAALVWARKLSFVYQPDYFLLMDADMELVVSDPVAFQLPRDGAVYDLYQRGGAVHYLNSRLVRVNAPGFYRGVTHEYLDIPTAGSLPESVAYFIDHADGANRPDKFKRDIRLLKADLKVDKDNPRSIFYLACSYRDAGLPEKAAAQFKRRVALGGWDEEVWQAQLNLAHCYKTMDKEADFIREALVAYNLRPQRAESMYDLAHHYRHGNMQAAALACAEAVEHLPKSTDALFVNDYVYKAGIPEEISISAYYVPGKRDKGYRVSSKLAMLDGPYGGAREQARSNMYFYLEGLGAFCDSFKWAPIPFTPEPGWVAMNPSVTAHAGLLWCNIRTVNYMIDDQGRYVIRGTDGTANNTNPIHTRNFLARLSDNPLLQVPLVDGEEVGELEAWDYIPCEFPLVVGFEDVRLFSYKGELWTSSTVRQIHTDGNCEQVLAKVNRRAMDTTKYGLTDIHRMLRQPRNTEKNWAPIAEGDRLRFMYRPLEVVNLEGVTVHKMDPGVAVDNVSGSSQLVPFDAGWLAITHEARFLPGSHLRYYYHRFAKYDRAFTKVQFSRPFYFNDKAIEFCAGMCYQPGTHNLVISYGSQDKEARIATVAGSDVMDFLCLDQ